MTTAKKFEIKLPRETCEWIAAGILDPLQAAAEVHKQLPDELVPIVLVVTSRLIDAVRQCPVKAGATGMYYWVHIDDTSVGMARPYFEDEPLSDIPAGDYTPPIRIIEARPKSAWVRIEVEVEKMPRVPNSLDMIVFSPSASLVHDPESNFTPEQRLIVAEKVIERLDGLIRGDPSALNGLIDLRFFIDRGPDRAEPIALPPGQC